MTASVAPRPVAADPGPRVPAGTAVYTRWIWWIVALPVVAIIPTIGYLLDLQGRMTALYSRMLSLASSGGRPDSRIVERLIADQLGLILNPWYLALILVGWTATAVVIWFAYLDRRDLIGFGYTRPFHWAWAFLAPPLVYVAGRTVVVRRQSGRGSAPMWVVIGIQAVWIALAVVWAAVFSASLFQLVFSQVSHLRS